MFSVVLFEPEIPPNTGNIIRLCANSGCGLHLIEPLGFDLEQKQLRRAGLDYHEYTSLSTWGSFDAFRAANESSRLIAFSTRHTRNYTDFDYCPGDLLLFGAESRGLPHSVRVQVRPDHRLRVPMHSNSRSLNLSNCVAIVVYEAWRQHGFKSA